MDFYLSSSNQNEFNFEDFEVAQIHDRIMNSIDEMNDMIDDPQENIAREDSFHFVKNEKICNFCNFNKICPKQ